MSTKDAAARTLALTAAGQNIVVSAGAGTGKTTLLVDRLCFLILARGLDIEKTAVLTFTEKAAAEVKARLMMKLNTVLQEVNNENTEDKTVLLVLKHAKKEDILPRAEAAFARITRAQVSTIHSFCSYILKKYPLEAGVSPSFNIDHGSVGENLFKRYWYKWINEELSLSSPRAEEWERVLNEVSLNDIYTYAMFLCSNKAEDYHPLSHADVLAHRCGEYAAEARALLALHPGKNNLPRALEAAAQVLEAAQKQFAARAFKEEDLPDVPVSAGKLKDWEDGDYEEALKILAFARRVHPARQKLINAVFNLVSPLTAQVKAAAEETGLVSYDGLLIKTRNLLKNNTSVRARLKREFDALFIDEFQDTDPVQGELLLFLAEEEYTSAARWEDIKLAPGKLFVVGDPKQSIYRFRGADIEAYDLFTELILKQNGAHCALQTNFRSGKNIIDSVNFISSKIIKQKNKKQPPYIEIFPHSEDSASAQAELWLTEEENGAGQDDLRHNQAENMAAWIEQNAGNMKLKNGKTLELKDIAVLFRARGSVHIYTSALKRRGIKYSVGEDGSFYAAQEIKDLANILAVIDDSSDSIALAGVLRSPFGGFNDQEILDIVNRRELSIYAKTGDARLAAVYAVLKKLRSRAGRVSLQQTLRDILQETFFTELACAAYNGEETVSNIKYFVSSAEAAASARPLSLNQFLTLYREKEELAREVKESDNPLTLSSSDSVNILTIHGAKGLEFPVVFFADTARQDPAAKAREYLYSSTYKMHAVALGKTQDANMAFLQTEEAAHNVCEKARLFYVALTRAKERLILLANNVKQKNSFSQYLEAAGLLGAEAALPFIKVSLLPYAQPKDFLYNYVHTAYEAAHTLKSPEAWREAWARRGEEYKRLKEEKLFVSPSGAQSAERGIYAADARAALTGSICHKVLEFADFKRALTEEDARAAAAFFDDEEDAPYIEESALRAAEILKKFCSSAVFKELGSFKIMEREMPFTLKENGRIVSGVIDLLAERGGEIYVFDYKTVNEADPGRYKTQTDFYRRAAQNIFKNGAVKCGIIFLKQAKIEYL